MHTSTRTRTRPWRTVAAMLAVALFAVTASTVATAPDAAAHPGMNCWSAGDATSTAEVWGIRLYRHRSNAQVCWAQWPWVDHVDTVTNRIEKIGVGLLDQTWTNERIDMNAHRATHTGQGGMVVGFNRWGINFNIDVRQSHEFTHRFFSNWNGSVAYAPAASSGWWWA